MSTLEFIFKVPQISCRALSRKGELRYIASKKKGSLRGIIRFAPPTKFVPKCMMGVFGLFDFRLPSFLGLVEKVNVSEVFLNQTASLLEIPVDRVGMYIGEPNERQKLLITDIEGRSHFAIKLAAGPMADAAIDEEFQASSLAQKDPRWESMVPRIKPCDAVAGKSALLVEKINGKQLSPDDFEREFISEKMDWYDLNSGGCTIQDWLVSNSLDGLRELEKEIEQCRCSGALEISSSLGLVHGDFAPWNIIRRVPSDASPPSSEFCVIDWEFSRPNTPLIFDLGYACWCYAVLLGKPVRNVEPLLLDQLVQLGALWQELRKIYK